jgi:hypothetical protein
VGTKIRQKFTKISPFFCAEPHHFYAAPAPPINKSFVAAPAPDLLYSKAKFLKQTKV